MTNMKRRIIMADEVKTEAKERQVKVAPTEGVNNPTEGVPVPTEEAVVSEANAEPEAAVYTQADMDAAIEKRLARERRKQPSKEELAEFKAWKAEQNPPAEDEALSSAKAKAESLEVKVACYEAGVGKDSVEAVTAIAEKMVGGDMDLEEAIEKVLDKYPTFKNDPPNKVVESKAWADKHQEGATPLSGVEESFFKLNPRLKQ